MIQRLQTVYLLLTTLFSSLFLWGPVIKFSDVTGSAFFIKLKGLSRVYLAGGEELIKNLLPLSALLVLIPILSLIIIFLFKKRKSQLRLCMGLIILIVLLITSIVFYSFYVTRNYNAEIIPGVKLILPVLMLFCAFLAYRGIKKDEKLIKSYERLR